MANPIKMQAAKSPAIPVAQAELVAFDFFRETGRGTGRGTMLIGSIILPFVF